MRKQVALEATQRDLAALRNRLGDLDFECLAGLERAQRHGNVVVDMQPVQRAGASWATGSVLGCGIG